MTTKLQKIMTGLTNLEGLVESHTISLDEEMERLNKDSNMIHLVCNDYKSALPDSESCVVAEHISDDEDYLDIKQIEHITESYLQHIANHIKDTSSVEKIKRASHNFSRKIFDLARSISEYHSSELPEIEQAEVILNEFIKEVNYSLDKRVSSNKRKKYKEFYAKFLEGKHNYMNDIILKGIGYIVNTVSDEDKTVVYSNDSDYGFIEKMMCEEVLPDMMYEDVQERVNSQNKGNIQRIINILGTKHQHIFRSLIEAHLRDALKIEDTGIDHFYLIDGQGNMEVNYQNKTVYDFIKSFYEVMEELPDSKIISPKSIMKLYQNKLKNKNTESNQESNVA